MGIVIGVWLFICAVISILIGGAFAVDDRNYGVVWFCIGLGILHLVFGTLSMVCN